MRVPALFRTGRSMSSPLSACWLLGALAAILLLPSTPALAQVDTDGETGDVDMTSTFERRSMTFFDTYISTDAAEYLSQQHVSNIERVVRQQVESLGR